MPYDENGFFWMDKPLKEGDPIPRVPIGLPQPTTVAEYKQLMMANARAQNLIGSTCIGAATTYGLAGLGVLLKIGKMSKGAKAWGSSGLGAIINDQTNMPPNDIWIGYGVESGPGISGDPVVLDINGNGIQTISVDQGPFVDFEGNGLAEKSGWVGPGEGLLCMDRNGNGMVDNVSELFCGHTPLPNGQLAVDGYQALAALDSNHDGKIDAQDTAHSQ
jgi:hypothetical protein